MHSGILFKIIIVIPQNNDVSKHISTTADFSSEKQRGIRYDPTTTTPLLVAIKASMCAPSLAKEKYDHALILDPSNRTNFVYPDANGTISLLESQAVFLSCPGANNNLNVPESHRSSNFNGRESEYRRSEIGFYTVGEEYFLKVIDIYYDRSSTSTMYAKSVVSKWIAGRQKPTKQHRYDQTHCCEQKRYRLDVDKIYGAVTLDRSFAELLYNAVFVTM
ncbi:hypothetical protein TSAR_017003 [Trichomalopsis sarcophagae]|uniref:Uncharacterized protein n=1 Tax=Trichomalopsis sarcophagae TaxID=543379 RepID=A0A232FLU1_9HYME|nr:hypothetical protein TSAR_017003 [Trichomalopsis sarcophagae]